MSTTLKIAVEDIATQILTYNQIRVYRSTSPTGTFSVVGTVALVSGTTYYSYADSDGLITHWYKYSLYHSTSLAESSLSAPFQVDGTSRQRIRQGYQSLHGVIQRLRMGFTVTAVAGSDINTLVSNDYTVKNGVDPTSKYKGAWIYEPTDNVTSVVTSSTPSTGTLELAPDLANIIVAGDVLELYRNVEPGLVNAAIQRGLRRAWLAERRPIAGSTTVKSYPLADFPELRSREYVANLYYRSSGAKVDRLWRQGGKTWDILDDYGTLSLELSHYAASGSTLYLEYVRPSPYLWQDSDISPVALDLAIILACDELLAALSMPGEGSAEDRSIYMQKRLEIQPELRMLLQRDKPQVNWDPKLFGRGYHLTTVGQMASIIDEVVVR